MLHTTYIAGKGKNNLPIHASLTRTLKASPQNFSTTSRLQHSIEQSHQEQLTATPHFHHTFFKQTQPHVQWRMCLVQGSQPHIKCHLTSETLRKK